MGIFSFDDQSYSVRGEVNKMLGTDYSETENNRYCSPEEDDDMSQCLDCGEYHEKDDRPNDDHDLCADCFVDSVYSEV